MDANTKSVKSLFNGPISYRIPPFQRPYCWNLERQWEPLWEDIKRLAERHGRGDAVTPHFMGAIVLQPLHSSTGEVTKRFVIDGQQRLVTIQLLLKAAEIGFGTLCQVDRTKRIGGMTQNESYHAGDDDDNLVKVRQSHEGDRQAFQSIMKQCAEGAIRETRLHKAFQFFRENIATWLQDESLLDRDDRDDRAVRLEAALSEHLQFVSVDLDDGEDPYTIFSTLNERGEILGPSDLIKNMLMQRAEVGEDEKKARTIWGIFEKDRWWLEQTRENNLRRTQADRFFDHWLTVRKSGTTRQPTRLAADFNHFLIDACQNRKQSVEDIVDNLNHNAEIYRQIQKVELEDAAAAESLQRMHDLKIGAPMPMMLWLFAKASLPLETKRQISKVVESYIVRRKLMKWPANGLVDVFAALLVKKADGSREEELVSTVVEHLRKQSNKLRWPNDAEVEDQLASQPMTTQKAVQKSILVAVERHLRCGKVEPLGDTRRLTLEHIMPRRWKEADWPLSASSTETRRELVEQRNRKINFIGNLTLITRGLNSSTGNRPWAEKKSELTRHSVSILNRKLLEEAPNDWDEQAIATRSKELARTVLEVWPGPDKYRMLLGPNEA